jgi:peptidoglycan/xylan/chitin deacetylase (PgdA/CDA1 family)
MSFFNHKILKKFERLFLFLSEIYNFLFSKNTLRVLVYHNIEKNKFNKLFNHLTSLKKKYNFITPKQFEEHILRKKILTGRNLLLSFDDGFKSNYDIEREILKKLRIKALFFVPSEFVQLKSKHNVILFSKNNILGTKTFNSVNNLDNLSIDNLKSLIKNGHEIGCHTKNHKHLGSINDNSILNSEIVDSKKKLEKFLKIKIKHFAFTYGDFKSINEKSLKLAFSNFKFIYSCLRGNNFKNQGKMLINRDPIYLDQDFNITKIFLSGLTDIRYVIFSLILNFKFRKFK